MILTQAQLSKIETIESIATALLPLAPPGINLAVTLALNAMHAVKNAQNAGKDVTPAQLEALFAADDQAKADDLLAQQEALQRKAKP